VVVVGRSGGGKSTLLRLVAGLDQPSAGAIAIDNQAVVGPPRAARMMFQDARLLPWQTVIANVGIARGPEWRRRALEALGAVGLAERAEDWPRILSGGQRQRVALARALVSRPSVLLLDEPFGALDALTRVEMHRLLEGLWREHGFTAILITHDVAEAAALAERVLALREGTIALDLTIPHKKQRRAASATELAALQARILAAV
jgi:sulfonate transport system ATP-binding protein